MKTLKQLAFFLFLGSSVALTSCGGDDPDPINKPTVTVAADKTSAAPGDVVRLTITAGAEEGLDNMKLTISTNNGPAGEILDTTFKSRTNAQIIYDISVAGNNGDKQTFVATVKDKKGAVATSQTTITVVGTGATDLQLCSAIKLGSYGSSTGSFFASSNCAVYTVSSAKSNQGNVDFLYFYGASNGATLAAPNDEAANTITTFQLNDWTTKNATMFKKLGGFDFNTATSANILTAYTTASGEGSKANMLAVGDVVGFKTAANKYGVAKVRAITSGANGNMTIDVKTQK